MLDSHVNKRRSMNEFYTNLFQEYEGVTVFTAPNDDYYANYWFSAILIDKELTNGVTREQLQLALEADHIESRPLWKPMHLQPIFASYGYYGDTVAQSLFENGLCLPSGSNLTDEDRKRITDSVRAVFSKK